MKDVKVIFMGTPDFACPILNWLIKNTNLVLVVTKEDKKVGRNQEVSFSPIKKMAIENHIKKYYCCSCYQYKISSQLFSILARQIRHQTYIP